METFSFTLKNNRNRKFLRIGWFVFVLNIVLFGYFYRADESLHESIFIPVLGLIWLITLILFMTVEPIKKREGKVLSVLLFTGAIAWVVIDQLFPAGLQLLMTWMGFKLPEQATIRFNNEGILVPALPYKKIEWAQVQHVIWKDGLLTIDFNNNTLIQEETIDEPDPAEQERFRLFCQEAISRSR